MPKASNPTQNGPEQSHIPPKRSSTISDGKSSTRASRHRSDRTTGPINHKTSTSFKADSPRRRQAGAASAGGGVLAAFGRALGLSQDSEQGNSADESVLLKRVEDLKKDNASMQRSLENHEKKVVELDHGNGRLQQKLHQATQGIEHNHRQYEKAIASFRTELKQSNARVATLQRKVAEDGEKLSKAYTAAVSTFALDVSRDLPDDIVKSSISTFFQGDFFSWCADVCIPEVAQQESAAQHLRSIGIINGGEEYLKTPKHLQFDMALSDGSSPLVLLQATLAKTLCDAFLTSPFFLAGQQQEALEAFEKALSRGGEGKHQFLYITESIADVCTLQEIKRPLWTGESRL